MLNGLTHIENILSSIYKRLNLLRKLKYKLFRTNLKKLNLVYAQVWIIFCGVRNFNTPDQLQLEFGRIVTGLPNIC